MQNFKIDIYKQDTTEPKIYCPAVGSVSIEDAIVFRNALSAAIREATCLGYQNFLNATKAKVANGY